MRDRLFRRSPNFPRPFEGLFGRLALAGVIIMFMVQGSAAALAKELRGQAKVISGNEIVIGKRSVRLFGMIAPGLKERCDINEAKIQCGIIAWAELVKLADGQHVSCDVEPDASAKDKSESESGGEKSKTAKAGKEKKKVPRGPPGTILATCYVSETDLNEALVRSGWAKAVREETDRYVVDESDAKESQRGLWINTKKRPRRKKK